MSPVAPSRYATCSAASDAACPTDEATFHDGMATVGNLFFKERLHRIWCGVNTLGDSGVNTLGDTSAFVNPTV